jgi:hypothetical protein
VKCWGVTSGDYSDYRVNMIFTDKDAANAYAAALNDCYAAHYGGECEVEEFPLNPTLPDYDAWWKIETEVPRPSYIAHHDVTAYRDGTLQLDDLTLPSTPPTHPRRPDVTITRNHYLDTLTIFVIGYDKEAVIHAYNDRSTKLLVELEQGVVSPMDFPLR